MANQRNRLMTVCGVTAVCVSVAFGRPTLADVLYVDDDAPAGGDGVEELERRVAVTRAVGVRLVAIGRVRALRDADLISGGDHDQGTLQVIIGRGPAQSVPSGRRAVININR